MRVKSLDIWRAIAVIAVIFHHVGQAPAGSSWLWRWMSTCASAGWLGVDLFFVLSGFLVSGLLFRELKTTGDCRLGNFLLRRGLKIYPAFYVFIGFTVCYRILLHKGITWQQVLSESLFVQNYGPYLWRHTWSLAVEEHFYIAIAIAIALILKWRSAAGNPADRLRPLLAIAMVVLPAALIARMVQVRMGIEPDPLIKYATHSRVDSLMFGMLLAYAYHFHGSWLADVVGRFRTLLIISGVALLLPAALLGANSPWTMGIGLTFAYSGFGALLMASIHAQAPASRLLISIGDPLAVIGSNSYSIYLWHWFVLNSLIISGIIGQHPPYWLLAGLTVGGSIVLGIGMAKIIEFPVLRLRDRMFPSRVSGSIP